VLAQRSVVAFHSNVAFDGDGTAGRSRDIWVLTRASRTPVRVTQSEPGRRVDRPALDAAGHTLVFESDAALAGHQVPPGQIEIWLYDLGGKSLKRITDAADIVVHPGPTYFLTGGKGNILEEALKRLK
jgi:Tol biopolymer transport system component